MSNLPAYFVDGPHAGECMMIGGAPATFLFPAPVNPLSVWQYLPNPNTEPWTIEGMKTDNYGLVREAILYKYRGRY